MARLRLRGTAPRAMLILLSTMVAALMVVAASVNVFRQHERFRDEAVFAAERNAGILAEYAGRSLGAVDIVLRAAAEALDSPKGDVAFDSPFRLATRTLANLPQVRGLAVYDAGARLLFSWPAGTAPAERVVRGLLAVHTASPPQGPYVSMLDETWPGGPGVVFSRGHHGPDGRLDGIVVAQIDISDAADLASSVPTSPHAALALWSDGGERLAHFPREERLLGDRVEPGLFSHMAETDAGSFDVDGTAGAPIVLSYRRVPGLPLVAVSAIDQASAMADWRLILRNHILFLGILVVTLVGLTVLLVAQMARRQRIDDRLRAAIAAGMDAFYILRSERDPHGRLVDFVIEDLNTRGARILMLERAAALGRRVSEVLSVQDPARFLAKLSAVVETRRPVEQELTLTEGPKGPVHLHHQIVPLGDGVAITSRNVTGQKRVEAELRAAKEAAESANRAKSDFLANMSHELRTPLNAILGFSETILLGYFGPVPQKQHGYIKSIHDAGGHLLSVINDVLDLSKIEAGKAELSEGEIELDAALDGAVALVQVKAAEKRLVIDTMGVPPGVELRGDALKLRQVFINLLSNAVKFTMPDGVVTIAAGWRDDGRFAISIADTGIGIAPGDLEKAMMPFGQVEQTYVRTQGGTGLGLPLAKSLVEMHGGALELESAPGEGTVVAVVLPPERVVAAPPAPQSAARAVS